ncbi:CHAT domain-containing protein [Streptomyces sp. DSM 44915]|uniref:CHAT domain-containing protein n=1 Tax=Streptomyces chisholmiae TaxID=3075540 RepID=A0ABU2JP91_9ACTN|nr:CHAT domain-containing protein [Streptomyces sp. DSM 44915]MDT0266529.1 CHAT domain-containing protein [Streptomyces sp. DSM 44915]
MRWRRSRGKSRIPHLDLGVVDGLDGSFQPTVQMKYVDAGDLYLSWRWEHAPDEPRLLYFERSDVAEVLTELTEALPTPLPGESIERALTRSLTEGPLTDPERETALLGRLTRAFLPDYLGAELQTLVERGIRPRLRIQPSPSTGQVPWEALPVDEGVRLVEHLDVATLPPATVRHSPERRISPWDPAGPVVAALDPRVPGSAAHPQLGSVLGPVGEDSPLRAMVAGLGDRLRPAGPAEQAFRRSGLTRDVLEPLLADAARFLYVGHVTTADHGLDARLHLGCGPETTGRAAPVGGHRPLTAADLVLGHRPADPRPWRMPNRVALVACESGGEVRFAEPTGLVAAAIHAGAEYVVSTRWTLPTDAGVRRFAATAEADTSVIGDAVVAVDAAGDAPDPVVALNDWQRAKVARWRETGAVAHSPVVWGAFTTTHG